MAKPTKNQPAQPQVDGRISRILACPLFFSTLNKYKGNKAALTALKEFILTKRADPMAQFGAKDYPFRGGHLKGYGHAGLTFDVSIIYTISGKNPTDVKLFGVFSHDALGTGTPAKIPLQKRAGATLANQTDFRPLDPVDETAR